MKNGEQFKIDFPPKKTEKGQIFIPYEEEMNLPNRRSHRNKIKDKNSKKKINGTDESQMKIDFPGRNRQQEFFGLTDEQYLKEQGEAIKRNQKDIDDIYRRPRYSNSEIKKQETKERNIKKIPPALLENFTILERFFKEKTKDIIKYPKNSDAYRNNSAYLGANTRMSYFKKLLEGGKFKKFYDEWKEMSKNLTPSHREIVLFEVGDYDGKKTSYYKNILDIAETLIDK